MAICTQYSTFFQFLHDFVNRPQLTCHPANIEIFVSSLVMEIKTRDVGFSAHLARQSTLIFFELFFNRFAEVPIFDAILDSMNRIAVIPPPPICTSVFWIFVWHCYSMGPAWIEHASRRPKRRRMPLPHDPTCGWRDSNPRFQLGRMGCCRCTTTAHSGGRSCTCCSGSWDRNVTDTLSRCVMRWAYAKIKVSIYQCLPHVYFDNAHMQIANANSIDEIAMAYAAS
jgi:hypothetical protein